MSNAESTNDTPQTARQEIWDRVAENFPTWQLPRLLGLDHLNKTLAAARARVNDSHKQQMAKLAEVSGNDMELENIGDEMSEIRVAGDTTYHITNTEPKAQSSMWSGLIPIALAAALGAGGTYLAAQYLSDSPTNAAPSMADWKLDLEVKNNP